MGDRSACDIESFRIQVKLSIAGDDLRSKRFIRFDQIDV
ncbi:Uncharacterised protein [Mycobacterium tuberculosis]|nr:Uncharacterised protein [Mycobacterium tuberculosis]